MLLWHGLSAAFRTTRRHDRLPSHLELNRDSARSAVGPLSSGCRSVLAVYVVCSRCITRELRIDRGLQFGQSDSLGNVIHRVARIMRLDGLCVGYAEGLPLKGYELRKRRAQVPHGRDMD